MLLEFKCFYNFHGGLVLLGLHVNSQHKTTKTIEKVLGFWLKLCIVAVTLNENLKKFRCPWR